LTNRYHNERFVKIALGPLGGPMSTPMETLTVLYPMML
jgi:hypothetical protein